MKNTLPVLQKKYLWALFSYDQRDVLSHQAKVEYVNPAKDMNSEFELGQ